MEPRDLLLDAARRVGWILPDDASFEQLRELCLRRIAKIEGAQDRAHAEYGIQSAIREAEAGTNPAYVVAGLWEAAKVLDLHAFDENPLRMEGKPSRSSRTSVDSGERVSQV